jgi:hypothetical protein
MDVLFIYFWGFILKNWSERAKHLAEEIAY